MADEMDLDEVDSKGGLGSLRRSFESSSLVEGNVKSVLTKKPAPCTQVGLDHQAFVPDVAIKNEPDDLPYENEDNLLWCPHHLSSEAVDEYLARSREISAESSGAAFGDEENLFILLQCGFDVKEALRRRKMNFTQTSVGHVMSPWSENECKGFEDGMVKFAKDFPKIQSAFVKTRSLAEVVEFYYLWKKTVRRDVLELKMRKDKKKCLDYMDSFVEHDYDARASLGRQYLLKSCLPRQSARRC